MELYAITFFMLIENSMQLDAQESLEKIQIVSIPHMSKGAEKITGMLLEKAGYKVEKVNRDTIERNRKILRNIMEGKKWQTM